MTLVQVLANEHSLHMCTDFQLSNPVTRKAVYMEAHKLVRIHRGMIGVTGIAFLAGRPVGEWIAEATSQLRFAPLQDILLALQEADDALRKTNPGDDRRLTFLIGHFDGSQSTVSLVSNFQQFANGRVVTADIPEDHLRISTIRPKGEIFIAAGDADSITRDERGHLTLALRSGAADISIQEEMSKLNVKVSKRTTTVSEGCNTASLHSTGAGSGKPFLTSEQKGDFISPDFQQMLKTLGLNLNPAIGPDGKPLPIREVQSAVASMGSSYEYFREQFKLKPHDSELWNNYGSFLIARRKYDDAIAAYEKALEFNPENRIAAANLAGNVWVHRDDKDRAEQLYSNAVPDNQTGIASWILSSYANFCDTALNNPERARDLYSRAQEDENNPIAAAEYAWFKIRRGIDAGEAWSDLEALLAAHPNNSRILEVSARVQLVNFRNIEAAREAAAKAVSLEPTNLGLLALAGDTSLMNGDAASAGYYYRKYIKREPRNANAQGNYGLALLIEGKVDGAFRHLAKAMRTSPDHLGIRTNMTATQWALGHNDDAADLAAGILSDNPAPEIELEVLGMMFVATASGRDRTTARIRELIEGGARTDGSTVRHMRQDGRSSAERRSREEVALVLEGKQPIPADW